MPIVRSSTKLVALSTASLLAAIATAQLKHGGVSIVHTFTSEPGVKFSTYDFRPKIEHKVETQPLEPENPTPGIPQNEGFTFGYHSVGKANLDQRVFGANQFWPGIGFTGWVPPDPNLGVGPSMIVTTVNSSVGFFTKGGTETFEQGFGGFFSGLGATSFLFDPRCTYDRIHGRYIVTSDELDTANGISKILIAISPSNNPNGTWIKYRIEAKLTVGGNGYWMDYPSMGFNKDALMISGNMFPLAAGGFGGVEFLTVPMSQLESGSPLTVTVFNDPNEASAQCARTVDSSVPYLYAAALASNSTMRVYALSNGASSPKLDFTDVQIAPFQGANGSADSVGGSQLETLPDRLFNLTYRSGHLYTGHSVATSNNDATSACRWYEFKVNGWPASAAPTETQAGNVAVGNDTSDFMPAMETNGAGDLAICFSQCSPTIVSDMMICGRKKTDAVGAMSVPVALKHGSANYGGQGYNRWGDYFDVTVDPVDDLTFWGINMVSNSQGAWVTEIRNWKISNSLNGTEINPTSASTFVGSNTGGSISSFSAIDFNLYSVASTEVLGAGQAAGYTLDYNLGYSGAQLGSLGIKYNATSDNFDTMFWYALNVTTNEYDLIKAFPISPNSGTVQFQLTNFANYVGPHGAFRLLVRALSGGGAHDKSFAFSTDMAHAVITQK